MDIHYTDTRLKITLKNPEKADLLEENRQAIREFVHTLVSLGVGRLCIILYLLTFTTIAKNIKKPFRGITRKDAEEIVAWISAQNLSPYTKAEYKLVLKRFIKWVKSSSVEKSTPFPPEVIIEEPFARASFKAFLEEYRTREVLKQRL